jgi:hypothetical protein
MLGGMSGVPLAMEPVVYDFAINEHGTRADLLADGAALMPPCFFGMHVLTPVVMELLAALPPGASLSAALAEPGRRTRARLGATGEREPAWEARGTPARCIERTAASWFPPAGL